jgi:hypothetical protein
VAYYCAPPGGQNRGQSARIRSQASMTDRIDATVDWAQTAARDPVTDRSPSHACLAQIAPRHEPMSRIGNGGDQAINVVARSCGPSCVPNCGHGPMLAGKGARISSL